MKLAIITICAEKDVTHMRAPVSYLFAITALFLAFFAKEASAPNSYEKSADMFLSAYAQSNKFWGTVLVARDGRVEFQKAYGTANISWNIPNSVDGARDSLIDESFHRYGGRATCGAAQVGLERPRKQVLSGVASRVEGDHDR
jgi:hypothetical protein